MRGLHPIAGVFGVLLLMACGESNPNLVPRGPRALRTDAPAAPATEVPPPSVVTAPPPPNPDPPQRVETRPTEVAAAPVETSPPIDPRGSAPPSRPSAKSPASASSSGPAGPDPEKVCQHVMDMLEREVGPALPEAKKSEIRTTCIQTGQKDRRDTPGTYACEAKCILKVESLAGVQGCKGAC